MTKRKKIVLTVILSLVLLLLAAAVVFFQFTDQGYQMSIPYRPNFEEIAPHFYVNKGNALSREGILSTFEQAKTRDTAFFGTMHCLDDITIIVCDDPKISGIIGEKGTLTHLFPQKKDYICISNENYNVDILAHELTHTELHSHFDTGKAQKSMPSWFDEGIATQNDYREQYSAENWAEQTENGKHATALADMDTPAEFYAGEAEERRFRYMCAKHEVAMWLEKHSVEELLAVADGLNSGKAFDELYFAE